MVRRDPSNALKTSGSWTVNVAAPSVGSFMSFENPARPWTTLFPANVTTVSDASQGSKALQVNGCFYTPVFSPVFNTTEVQPVTGRISMDVKARSLVPNPRWTGTIRLRVTMPNALVFNALIDTKVLVLAPIGNYTTLSFAVPAALRSLLQGNRPGSSFTVEVETVDCLQPLVIDNIRFN
jgi:hypothetical protein